MKTQCSCYITAVWLSSFCLQVWPGEVLGKVPLGQAPNPAGSSADAARSSAVCRVPGSLRPRPANQLLAALKPQQHWFPQRAKEMQVRRWIHVLPSATFLVSSFLSQDALGYVCGHLRQQC